MTDQRATDDFPRGYAEAALFTSSVEEEWGDEHGIAADVSMDSAGFTVGDIDVDTLASMRAACASFIAEYADDLTRYVEIVGEWHGSDTTRGADARYSAWERAGSDFWLSRNGHGAGYFDRGDDPVFSRLQACARLEGEVWLYITDDGEVSS